MAGLATHSIWRARRRLAVVLATVVGLLLVGASPAFAVSEPPVWLPISRAEPTNVVPGSPVNAVQKLVVNATGGSYTITAEPRYYPEMTGPINYNASAAELEEKLNALHNTMDSWEKNTALVKGGPTPTGAEYEIEFTGYTNSDHKLNLLQPHTEHLTGGAKTATVTTARAGGEEGLLVVSATNTGGPTNGSTVTVEDELPPGLTATSLNGADAYRSRVLFDYGIYGAETPMECSPKPATEQPLRCTIKNDEIVTGDTLILVMHVKATNSPGADEMNRVTVSGGGARRSASNSNQIPFSSTPAPYGITPGTVESALSSTQAGAHASLTTAFTINTKEENFVSGTEKDIRFDLPPGLVGNITRLPKCTMARVLEEQEHFGGERTCPSASMVGVATLQLEFGGFGVLGLTVPIYAITPAPGEPIAFAFDAWILPVRLDTSVLSAGNYGVRVTAPDLNEAGGTMSSWITIWGVPADHSGPAANPNKPITDFFFHPFGGPDPNQQRTALLTSPQECGSPMQAILTTDSWAKQGVFLEEPTSMAPLVGCEALNMQPAISMLPDTLEAAGPAGYTMDLEVPQILAPDSLATPTIKTVKLALPVGTVVSPGVAWGLKTCSEAQFGLHSGQLANCPREAQVGEVEIETPNLPEKLRGQVYLATPLCDPCTPEDAQDGKMIQLYVQAVSLGESKIIVKLDGEGSINQQTGQITTTFAGNPPLPFDKFDLKLGGGPRAALANPRECGPATTNMDLTPWSSPFTEDSSPTYTFDITENCFGPQFHPTLVAQTTSIQSGEYSPFTLAFGRSDDDGYLAGLQEQLPPGLLGKIAGVTLCREPQASEGECPANSLIGHVQALTGPGADPFLVTDGAVYLTGPYKGAPFGLSIAVPAVAGPYTLSGSNGKGAVVVRAAINVDKENAHLTVTADPLPVELDGIPLQIKVIDVTIDRPEFTFNPTSCERMHIKTLLTSLEGAAVNAETPFQVTNCVGLGFNPRFEVTTSGHTSRTEGASLDARLIYPLGRKLANVKNVRVELPKQLPSRLTTLQKACPDYVFAESPEKCPAPSRVGQARAATPILPNELEGWAYFVSHGGVAFPNLIIVLQDRTDGVRVDLVGETFISKAGITSTTFGTVPDVPISEFELYLPEGPNSALAANGDLCRSVLAMPTEFHGQNGGVLKENTPVGVTGCPKAARARRAGRGHVAARHRKGNKRKRQRKRKKHNGASRPSARYRRGK